ncbi:MAG TPA: fused MFS/spermidine synthase [Candidatus Polarisedimenticolia bacterium]|nr:fused MFS/spermidine synthase [Candidatus Polarisedimenticolia bacterium]
MRRYAVTIFLSAFLLFQIQPLISKVILPWFGGGTSVWTTCLLFFQVALLGGYAYAHWSSSRLKPRSQAVLHLALLAAAILLMPILPGPGWKPPDPGRPTLRILTLLGATIGLPYFMLATTGPLLQRWRSLAMPGLSPYRLYALSNAGSLLALLTYPVAVEPLLSLRAQSLAWSAGFVLFCAACVLCAASIWKGAPSAPAAQETRRSAAARDAGAPRLAAKILWLLLAVNGSLMLLAVTNQMCQDIASVPFLWVVPLTLYLVSFIICFERDRWYSRKVFWTLEVVAAGAMVWALIRGPAADVLTQVSILSLGLFAACMVSHGELVRLRPAPEYLTSFYLMIAAGGALGAVFVSLIAPAIFRSYLELNVGIWTTFVVALVAYLYSSSASAPKSGRARSIAFVTAAVSGVVVLNAVLTLQALADLLAYNVALRNFYGVLRVQESDRGDPLRHRLSLFHGRVSHGWEFTDDSLRRAPTAYYGENSGVGLALRYFPHEKPLRVGVVGLGVGTVATYGQEGDTYRFYEINPDVGLLAESQFVYLRDSSARHEIVPGDARLSLERERPQGYDVLVLDAFNGDSVPIHLLTREAFGAYRRHLAKGGLIAANISNLHVDLRPVVWGVGEDFGYRPLMVDSPGDWEGRVSAATWVLLTHNQEFLNRKEVRQAAAAAPPRRVLWTDSYSNLFTLLKWR